MEPGTRLTKTDRGRQEIAQRSGALTPVERRLLVLVDGHKTVNDLDAYVRVGERDAALHHLLALGLVAPDGPAAALGPANGASIGSMLDGIPAPGSWVVDRAGGRLSPGAARGRAR